MFIKTFMFLQVQKCWSAKTSLNVFLYSNWWVASLYSLFWETKRRNYNEKECSWIGRSKSLTCPTMTSLWSCRSTKLAARLWRHRYYRIWSNHGLVNATSHVAGGHSYGIQLCMSHKICTTHWGQIAVQHLREFAAWYIKMDRWELFEWEAVNRESKYTLPHASQLP